ncbi:D-aminoacyl-tRNA deacylase, partial [candidate division WOR-3 bacterium]|nr:D-aminoacyl-tRNA deacylase [candidate division WOR-3 bacterium]
MIAVVQRVKKASCHVEGKQISKIGNGLLILLGVANDDTEDKVLKLAERC